MSRDEKMEKKKKRDTMRWVGGDEAIVFASGMFVFLVWHPGRIPFIVGMVLWYWMKIRGIERKIYTKGREIFNEQYEQGKRMAPMSIIEGHTEYNRGPIRYDLEQLERLRRFMVDKFVAINLFVLVLLQIAMK